MHVCSYGHGNARASVLRHRSKKRQFGRLVMKKQPRSNVPCASDGGCRCGRRGAVSLPQRRRLLTAVMASSALFLAGPYATAFAGSIAASLPDARDLLHAGEDDGNWVLPAKTYAGNRYISLMQIDKANVGSLGLAWRTDIADDGEQEAAPIVWKGVMYISTPHDGVLALDASNGKLLWQAAYNPAYVMLFAANRGVGLADGKVFIATQDCRVIALDAGTGKSLWNVAGCRDTSNSWYSMAAYVYKNQIILGTGGGDTGNIGLVSAFSTKDGKRLWDWQTIPGPGEPGHETWPGDSWKTGGAAIWNVGAYDPDTNLTFWGIGNPSPDTDGDVRLGDNLYSDSVVALDADTGKLKWYYQFTPHDTMDYDATQVPVLADITFKGAPRKVMLWANRNGLFYVLDRVTGQFLLGKPFANTNWLTGFDEKGRPMRVPGQQDSPVPLLVQPNGLGGTNWYPPSFSPHT